MPTILVVDDERSMRRALRGLFEQVGWTVEEAGSGEAALETVAAGSVVDAVVCDVRMPGTSGLAFYDELVTRAPGLRTRVVFLTGAAHEPDVHGSAEQRGVPLVSKLDDLQLVVDAVKVALLRR